MEDIGLAKLGRSTRKFERHMTDFYMLPRGALPGLRRPRGLAGAGAPHRRSAEPSACYYSAALLSAVLLLPSRLYRWFRLPALVLAFRVAIAHMSVSSLF